MNPEEQTTPQAVPDLMDQPTALGSADPSFAAPVEPAVVTTEPLPAAPIEPVTAEVLPAEPLPAEVPPTAPVEPEPIDGSTPVPPKSNTKFIIIGLGMLVVALLLLSGFLAVQYIGATNSNKSSSSVSSSSSSTTTTSKSSSSSSKSSSSSSSSKSSSNSTSSTSSTIGSPLDEVTVPADWKLYKNTSLGYAFALPTTYTTSFANNVLAVRPTDVTACDAMDVEIVTTATYDPTGNGTATAGNINEEDNIGAIPGTAQDYYLTTNSSHTWMLTQVDLDATRSMVITHEETCSVSNDPSGEITPETIRQMMDSFKFAD